MSRRPDGLAAVALICMALAGSGLAQTTPSKQEGQSGDQITFKANVSVVNIFFNVRDKHGVVSGLTKDDFQIAEDNKPQTIKYFRADADQPLTLGIMIDTSASQMHVLGIEQQAGGAFLRQVLRKDDLAFVISFDINVDLLQDFTASTHDLDSALDRAKINQGGNSPLQGPLGGGGTIPVSGPRGTLLYDAIYLAANEKLASEVGRKAMIILTDGQDAGSREKIADAIEAAQKSDSICYVLLIADRGFYGGFGLGYNGDRDMRKLAEETGGRVIDVGNNEKKLKEAFDQISNELRTQYNIGYTPTNAARDGGFRRIEIKTKQGYKVESRSGYYATAPK